MITNYPTSLCNCFNNDCDNTRSTQGYNSNLSIKNCDFKKYDCNIGKYNDCGRKEIFKQQIEPRLLNDFDILNKNVYKSAFDKTFQKVDCPRNNGCNSTVYTSNDPRLVSVVNGGQIQTLDRPPLNASIKLADIYTDPSLKNYGANYKSYDDINAGDIVYYIDKSIEDAFFQPNFTNPSNVTGVIYKDPMSAFKPVYERKPIKDNNMLDTNRNRTYNTGLSFLNDTNEHREDLMSKQMYKTNKNRYSSRWSGQISQ